jgi:ankyrin repeat protein
MTMSQAIFQAIRDGDASQVATLVEMDASLIHATDDEHNRPLHYAAARGHLDIARKLLDAGADVDGENEPWEWRPIVHASWCNQIEMVKLLIERGAQVRREGGQPIHYAGQQGHREICRILVEAGAIDDLVAGDDPGALAVFRAAYGYDADGLAKLLAQRSELVHARDIDDATPLHEAGTNGAIEVIRVLIEAGANVNERRYDGATPIQRAALHSQIAACAVLRDLGAEFSFPLACRLGWIEAAGRMLQGDPSLAKATHNDIPIIEGVCEAGYVDMGRILVDAGADVSVFTACSLGLEDHVSQLIAQDSSMINAKRGLYAYEPLHCAAECGHAKVIELLLAAGADVNVRNSWNFTPLHLAVIGAREQTVTEDHYAVCSLLLDRGADPNALDDYDRSPLCLANSTIEHCRRQELDLTIPARVQALIAEHAD